MSTHSGLGLPNYEPLVYIELLASDHIPVINLSFGYPESSFLFGFDAYKSDFLKTIRAHKDILFVVAAGNDGLSVASVVPAAFGAEDNVIIVGASDFDDSRSLVDPPGPSNFGELPQFPVNIAAPRSVWSPSLAPTWTFFTGTSASAPMVMGAAAILKSLQPGLSPASLKSILINSGDTIVTIDAKPIGGRGLNVLCAVEKLLPSPVAMNDDFNTNSLDCGRWDLTVVPPGVGTVRNTNQELEMVKVNAGGSYQGLASRCSVSGDFDVQVDYKLLNWPAQNFHTVRLAAKDLPDGQFGHVGIYTNSYGNENYQFRSQSPIAETSTSDIIGAMRLTRSLSTVSGYYSSNGGPFQFLGSAPSTSGDTGFVIDFSTPLTTAAGNIAIAFDNFEVNSGLVVCP